VTKAEAALPVEVLQELFVLHADGTLTWLARPASHFRDSAKRSAAHIAANWNSRNSGRHALSCCDRFGHLTGRINDQLFYAHRVVWAMHYSEWPKDEIDHINGNGSDNRIENLRDVPHAMNLRNQSRQTNNTTGVTGVNFFKRDKKWVASITVDGRSRHLGYFFNKDEAKQARLNAERLYGFHPNHGRQRS
jgi:hypothetical protein